MPLPNDLWFTALEVVAGQDLGVVLCQQAHCTTVAFQFHFNRRTQERDLSCLPFQIQEQHTKAQYVQDVEQFSREKEELEKDRLRMHAENDALQNKLEELERHQEHNFIQGTMKVKKEYEQKMEEVTKRWISSTLCLELEAPFWCTA